MYDEGYKNIANNDISKVVIEIVALWVSLNLDSKSVLEETVPSSSRFNILGRMIWLRISSLKGPKGFLCHVDALTSSSTKMLLRGQVEVRNQLQTRRKHEPRHRGSYHLYWI